ncbi:PREDICTED: tesmin [Gavialis gangeticus]|uniref:tesmin n=1 Tax=Gavialis gangeticus TaxID=94835 RepID=UPI00092EACBC|nr:PREDICTED: tesmin [Gavialis gangeticus]
MENQSLLSGISSLEEGVGMEMFSQHGLFGSELFSVGNEAMNAPPEDRFHSGQDTRLCTVAVEETLLDHFKYPLNIESHNAVLEVEMEPVSEEDHDNETLGKQHMLQELNLSEEIKHLYPPHPQLQPYNVHFLSSLAMQHKNTNVVLLSACSPEGTVNQNVRLIPIFRPLLRAGENNCICYDQFKEMLNSSVQSQGLQTCSDEPSSGPQTSDEFAELRQAVISITPNNQEEAALQNSDTGETSCKLLASENVMEELGCLQREDSSPVVICQVKGSTQILCINSSGTRDLKTVHLAPHYQDQHNYLQSDTSNPMMTLLGQFLSVPGKLDLSEQQLDNGSLQTVASSAEFHPEPDLQGSTKVTLIGLPLSSWDIKSRKPCNCTKSQCLKLYCDCFANGDFCSNCNCNNCYNNPLHETERFKAIKACLDRNPEAFLPKIGKGKTGDIKPRHNKGCNCKRSGCLKNYCECFEAKIMCSSICKCIGCKNYEESPDRKTLMNMPDYTDIRNNEEDSPMSTSAFEMLSESRKDGQTTACISWDIVEATCACLLAQAEEAEKEAYSICVAEQMILEEFGRCLSQILHSEFKSQGVKVE